MSAVALVVFILVAVVIQIFAVVRHALVDEIGLAASDEVEGRTLGELHLQLAFVVGVGRDIGIALRVRRAGEEAHIAEHIRIEARDVAGMVAAHREAGNGTVLLVGLRAEILVDELHHIGESTLERALAHLLGILGSHAGHDEALGRFARGSLLPGVAVGHHHNHRLGLALRDEVVQDLRRAPQSHPSLLVTTGAVQEIEDGITLAAGFITGRSVDRHAAFLAQRGAVIPHTAHRAVRHIVHFVEVCPSAADDEDIGHCSHVAVDIDVGRVQHLQAVHDERVAVELGTEGFGRGELPHAVLAFLQVGDACRFPHAAGRLNGNGRQEVARHLHTHGFRRLQAESDGIVVMYLGGDNGSHPPQSLLGVSHQPHQAQYG